MDSLLKWANKHSRGHDHIHPIDDYGETLADGLGFCALVYASAPLPPPPCPLDPRSPDLSHAIYNPSL